MLFGLMRVVGLTGGIASGKSTVALELRDKYALPVIDADRIAHEVVEPGSPCFKKLVKAFGAQVVGEDGKLNRALLADTVFSDAEKRRTLNNIIHPAIAFSIAWKLLVSLLSGVPLVILDAPLLFETGLNRIADFIVVVSCTREQQLSRYVERTQSTEEQADKRIKAQKPLDFKVALADVVIDNSGTREATRAQVKDLVERWNIGPSGWIPRIRELMFHRKTLKKQ